MEWLKKLRIYLSCEAGQHAVLLGGFLALALMIFWGIRHQNSRSAAATNAASWPLVEARILTSQIHEVDASSETSFATRLSVKAGFSYEFNGATTQGSYVGVWYRNDHRDWSDLLRPGGRINVRVSPRDPGKVSLVDYNGIQ